MIVASIDWALILALATTTVLSSVAVPSTVMATSSPLSSSSSTAALATTDSSATTADVHRNLAHKNMAAYTNYLALQPQQQQQQLQYHYDNSDYGAATHVESVDGDPVSHSDRRSYTSSSNAAGAFNGLKDSTGWRRISSGYGAADAASATTTAHQKQQIPIYEEQQENDYAPSAAGVSTSGSYADYAAHPSNTRDSISRAIYNLRTAGAHNNYENNDSKFAHALTTYPSHTIASAAAAAAPSTPPQSSDKSYGGNFLHHYERNAAYDDLTAADSADSHSSDEQQLQYFAPHAGTPSAPSSSSYPADVALPVSFEHSPLSSSHYDDVHSHYPATGSAHSSYPDIHSQKQPDVINYIPYPVVKKLHVPVHEPVQIPFSHAVIVPIRKPVPIQIPVVQQVQVPVEQELKIPVERVVPYPVEKQVPVPVEKRVPYPVVKYVPVKIPHPFPVKVPVFKTVLHKVKGWW